jgi:DNA mismatch repair protein MutS
MIYDDYEAYLTKYKEEYGENTLVLMECGSFYELYDDGSKNTDLKQIGELLNIQVSRRNKAVIEVSRSNLEMAGFPSYTLKKFLDILVLNNYTIVVVSQVTPPPNPKREVTNIVSPGTYIEEALGTDSNYLMSIYVEQFLEYKTNKKGLTIGASLVDLGTGKTHCLETTSRTNDVLYPLDELYRFTSVYNPKEVTLYGDLSKIDEEFSFQKIVSHLDLEGKCVHNDFIKFNPQLLKLSYQEEILKRVYPLTGMLSCIEVLGLERKPCAIVSFVRLLQFVNNHNEHILSKIRTPEVVEESDILVLSYNSVKQLDIAPRDLNTKFYKAQSLYDILNNCKTAVGRRYFKERLMSPSNNPRRLEESYRIIEALKSDEMLENLKVNLGGIYDIERLFRKINICTIHPCELGNLYASLIQLKGALKVTLTKIDQIMDCNLTTMCVHIDDTINMMKSCLNIDEILKYNLDNISALVFKRGKYDDLDELHTTLTDSVDYFVDVAKELNTLCGENVFKLDTNERDGYHLLITNKRYQEFLRKYGKGSITFNEHVLKIQDLSTKPVSQSSTSVKVLHKSFSSYNDTIELLKNKLKRLATDKFRDCLRSLSCTCSKYFVPLCNCLAFIDFYWCCAYNAEQNKYTRPLIKDKCAGKSFMQAKGLRHPIIEKISQDTQYVSNDIELGVDGQNGQHGVLLYGLNSSGKSSLMKSIGLAVIMAQAGMYVSCDSLEYYPYDYVFTRILSCDDIFKGQSTFTKEILELRGILKRANDKSLVLGDELCSGTESISALSIVSAGVYTLAIRKSSFVFATHLHDLINIPLINDLNNVNAFHLSVTFDPVVNRLIYDRKLKSGNGSTLYGLEVCKSLDLDPEFLSLANAVRQNLVKIHKDILPSTSNMNKYNKDVYVDKCQVCGNHAKEVHHITQQKDADDKGYIGNFHKDAKFNLVCLCDVCHNKVHHGNLEIFGYTHTSDGVILNYSQKRDDSVLDESAVKDYMKALIKSSPHIKKKDMVENVQSNYQISKYKIDIMLKLIKGIR